ncbi:UNVERIFIED_CONTAM: hypothetical protein Slati_1698400 [Sesamum latifolium]|uniref:Reverse transcriptase zinc-binding domain-containing protein n=1 Tax=Sesamum latifolium TaxID=2727402 RepID=A0AAW2WVK7_9LAMI
MEGGSPQIRIWHDNWLLGVPNFRLSHRHAFYGQRLQCQNLLTRQVELGSMTSYGRFRTEEAQSILSIPLATGEVSAIWTWNHQPNGIFTVKSSYILEVAWREQSRASSSTTRSWHLLMDSGKLWRVIWGSYVPPKVRICMWRVCLDALPTIERLAERMMK